MSILRHIDMQVVDQIFEMKSGFVIHLSNRTFAQFFQDELGVDIYDQKYAEEGDSKARRLRFFLKSSDDKIAAKTLLALWDYREAALSMKAWTPQNELMPDAHERLLAIVRRLTGTPIDRAAPKERGSEQAADNDKRSIEEPLTSNCIEAKDHLVLLVHGINTRALWMGDVKNALESSGFTVAPTSYGQFGILRFLAPFRSLRNKAIDRVAKDIRTARRSFSMSNGSDPKRMSVISHSFGTYVVGRLLTDYPEFKWDRIIFCGSVVRDDFPLDQVLERFVHPLLNEIGTKDFLPAMAESAGWGYGSVGSTGFNRPPVETRWHHGFRHSDFLSEEFCNKFWIPFLRGVWRPMPPMTSSHPCSSLILRSAIRMTFPYM
jgi:pimeloyl-ACP methyl ester carboxylesterase